MFNLHEDTIGHPIATLTAIQKHISAQRSEQENLSGRARIFFLEKAECSLELTKVKILTNQGSDSLHRQGAEAGYCDAAALTFSTLLAERRRQ